MRLEEVPDYYWRAAEVVGVWLGAVATFLAAAVALWISGQQNRISLALRAAAAEEYEGGTLVATNVWITVTNMSSRPVTIASIGWKLGPFSKVELWQKIDDPRSFRLPGQLGDGQKADFFI